MWHNLAAGTPNPFIPTHQNARTATTNSSHDSSREQHALTAQPRHLPPATSSKGFPPSATTIYHATPPPTPGRPNLPLRRPHLLDLHPPHHNRHARRPPPNLAHRPPRLLHLPRETAAAIPRAQSYGRAALPRRRLRCRNRPRDGRVFEPSLRSRRRGGAG